MVIKQFKLPVLVAGAPNEPKPVDVAGAPKPPKPVLVVVVAPPPNEKVAETYSYK